MNKTFKSSILNYLKIILSKLWPNLDALICISTTLLLCGHKETKNLHQNENQQTFCPFQLESLEGFLCCSVFFNVLHFKWCTWFKFLANSLSPLRLVTKNLQLLVTKHPLSRTKLVESKGEKITSFSRYLWPFYCRPYIYTGATTYYGTWHELIRLGNWRIQGIRRRCKIMFTVFYNVQVLCMYYYIFLKQWSTLNNVW